MAPEIPLLNLSRLSIGDLRRACTEFGFFQLEGHGVSESLQARLETLSAQFFHLPLEEKMGISMAKGGRAWRGFFPVGDELTSGRPDLKEGIYFGSELGMDDPRVKAGLPLHGPNLFPKAPEWRETVVDYMNVLTRVGHELVAGISESLGLPRDHFRKEFTKDPITLFRIFHYPPVTAENEAHFPWGVGEHTDYGLLTILKQDDCGGLEVKTPEGWIAVPPRPNTFVCNIGDMLDSLTQGRYRSAPHRVRNVSGRNRYSYPFFFDPGFQALVRPLPLPESGPTEKSERWDHENLYGFQGTYGDYLLKKVSKVFPMLAESKLR